MLCAISPGLNSRWAIGPPRVATLSERSESTMGSPREGRWSPSPLIAMRKPGGLWPHCAKRPIFTPVATSLLLPPSAERVVNLHQRKPLVQLSSRQIQLRSEIVGLTGEHLQITRSAASIPHVRQPVGIRSSRGQPFLVFAKIAEFAVRRQRVGDLPE